MCESSMSASLQTSNNAGSSRSIPNIDSDFFELVAKYAETMIRRTFGTTRAMKVYNDKIEVEEVL